MGGPGSGVPGQRKTKVIAFRPSPTQLAHIEARRGRLSQGEYMRALVVKDMRGTH